MRKNFSPIIATIPLFIYGSFILLLTFVWVVSLCSRLTKKKNGICRTNPLTNIGECLLTIRRCHTSDSGSGSINGSEQSCPMPVNGYESKRKTDNAYAVHTIKNMHSSRNHIQPSRRRTKDSTQVALT
ncbi:uncharacterized protein LOC105181763 [Harpegnathos saltator]|uniref:uncharacterized protein LOC105181763 n=1 Tax=Harpegnathos saltator TaxID=610380 RepID=UPI00058F623C|nr:uncharacterized protein LOC105181763 [Harpegnathos saltator]